MKIVAFLSFIALFFNALSSSGQHARFVRSGEITFEKRVNMYAKIKSRIGDGDGFMAQAYEQYRKTQPQFKSFNYSLSFGRQKALFRPAGEKEVVSMGFFGNDPSIDLGNTIYTDLDAGSSISQKSVYEETFLVDDSTRKIAWKITDEFREIAGFDCRRANAIIMDSIYVVAFYTDRIPVSGGPESFTGLPGMILGVALPYENTTWFATKVEDKPVAEAVMAPPKKGKSVNQQQLKTQLESSLKNWGEYAHPILKALMM